MLNKKLVKSETSWLGTVRKMAESKGALIAKTVQKHAGRAKEKVCNFFGYCIINNYIVIYYMRI